MERRGSQPAFELDNKLPKYKSFRYTPNGLIFAADIKSVYSVFLICAKLTATQSDSKKILSSFNKGYPYSFSLATALSVLRNMVISSKETSTCITISYRLEEKLAVNLLNLFMTAQLLHCPADRTRCRVKDNVLMQPTPKGVAILRKFSRDIGLKIIPEILTTSLNSMNLFLFERSSVSDSIIQSDYLIHILFIRMMGTHPNYWSPTNKNDPLPTLGELLDCVSDTFTFENFDELDLDRIDSEGQLQSVGLKRSWSDQIDDDALTDCHRESPLAHKFFTNPDSDAHVQYYVSDSGLRCFHSKCFGGNKLEIKCSFTSKAIWQWLMDCTDILYPQEGIAVASLFLKVGLMVPILLPPSETSRRKFSISRSSYFTLSRLGTDILQWNIISPSKTPAGNIQIETPNDSVIDTAFLETGNVVVANEKRTLPNNINDMCDNDVPNQFSTLHDILRDPGVRYLFRLHLEKEVCAENLYSYIDIKKFLKRMTVLKKIMESKYINDLKIKNGLSSSKNNIISTINSALIKQANECLEMGYRIFSTYIMVGAPRELNIDHTLRQEISSVMLHPRSPITEVTTLLPSDNLSSETIPRPDFLNTDFKLEPIPQTHHHHPFFRDSILSSSRSIDSSKRIARPTPLDMDSIYPNVGNIDNICLTSLASPSERDLLDRANQIPMKSDLKNTVKILKQLYPLYEEVATRMYKIMSTDSLQKFYASKLYSEINSIIKHQSHEP